MLGMCVLTSGGDPATYSDVLGRATATTPLALALLARLGAQLGCEPTNEAVSAARLERLRADATGYLQELWRDARIEGLVVDEGFPLPIIPSAELEREAGVAVHRVVRIEPWIAEDRDGAAGYDELEDALSARLEAAAAAGRGGLQVGDRLPHGARHHAPERRRRARRSRAGARTASARRARTPSPCATGCSSARSRSPRRAACRCTSTRAAAIPTASWRTPGPRGCSTCSSAIRSSRCC